MANIQKLWTSYTDLGSDGNQTTGITFIGEQGRLWYDPVTNTIRASDGSTPGGTIVNGGNGGGNTSPGAPNGSVQFNSSGNFAGDANFTFNSSTNTLTVDYINANITSNTFVSNTANLGNFTISDQTLAGTVSGRDVTISTVGNSNVNILGGFHVHTDGNLSNTAQFSAANGIVEMLVPVPDSLSGAVSIVGSATGNAVSPQNYGVLLHLTGQPSTPSRIYNDGAANYAAYIGRRYNGTAASPTPVLANQTISRVGATPYIDGNTNWPNVSTTRIDFVATQNQNATQQGSRIELWTTNDNANTVSLTAKFETEGIVLQGNVIPNTNAIFQLGNATNKWANLYLGPDSLFIEDTVLHTDAEITVTSGQLFINGVNAVRVGNMSLTANGISTSNTAQSILMGNTSDTGYTVFKNVGIEFRDGTQQTTAAIPLTQKGNALGVVPLNSSVKIDPVYLPAGGISYQGTWNAATNTPTLADGTGTAGQEYIVATSGTQNLGSGSITFSVGDGVLYNGTIWQRVAGIGSGVTSFNTRTGAVTLQSGDVTNALSNASITNNFLANPNLTITTGNGLSGGGVVALGGSLTLSATVRDITAGTGVTVTPSSGSYAISIGQPVGTGNSVTFAGITSTTTIAATANVTGGNLTTAGQVVASGNIVTSGNLKTSNTTINASLTSNGVINFTASPNVSLGAVGNLHITGGTNGYVLQTDGSGNLSWTNFGTPGQALYYGSFYSTATQTNPVANTANPMTFDTTDFNNGISIVSNSRITFANSGRYNILFSAQVDKTDAGTDEIDIWLSKNGVNVPNTNTQLSLQNQSAKQVAAWNFFVQATAGDYFELYWSSADTGMRLLAVGTQLNPTRPAVPSVILTVTQI